MLMAISCYIFIVNNRRIQEKFGFEFDAAVRNHLAWWNDLRTGIMNAEFVCGTQAGQQT